MNDITKTMIRWFSLVAIFLIFGIVAIVVNLHPYEINFNADEEMEQITDNMMKMAYAPTVCENQTTIIIDNMDVCIKACKWSFQQAWGEEDVEGVNGFMRDRDCAEYCYQTIEKYYD